MSRDRLLLGFKAFDLHELLPHFVAAEMGAYSEQNLDVRLQDTTFLGESEWPPNLFSTACGGALCSALAGGPQRIILAAVRGPMFWLAATAGIGWEGLRGGRIAGYPTPAPPHLFLRIVLREKGLDPQRDVRIDAVRDDVARLGLLREKQVSAALLSSAVLPSDLKREGLEILTFLADHLHLPTSGLAVGRSSEADDVELRNRLLQAHRRALQAIAQDLPGVVSVQRRWLPGVRPRFRAWMRCCFLPPDNSPSKLWQPSLDRLAEEMGTAPRPARDVFL